VLRTGASGWGTGEPSQRLGEDNDPERPQRSRVPGGNAPGALTDAGQYSGAVGAPHRSPGTLEEGPAQLLQPGCRPLDVCAKLAEPIEPPAAHESLTVGRRSGTNRQRTRTGRPIPMSGEPGS
jgi:hypothetical protein